MGCQVSKQRDHGPWHCVRPTLLAEGQNYHKRKGVPYSNSVREPTTAESVQSAELGYLGAKQQGHGPEMWGITLQQLLDVPHERQDTMRDVVERKIKPLTGGRGIGYALLLNSAKPLQSRTMVSHAWDESYYEFVHALSDFADEGPFWVCAMSIYQNEDREEVTIAKQLGPDPMFGPFATVLKQASKMIAVVSSACDIYTRMWCVLEMFVALGLKLNVQVAQFASATENNSGWGASMNTQAFELPLFEQCKRPVRSELARCANPKNPINADELAIRKTIEGGAGYEKIDMEVEKARLSAVLCLMRPGSGEEDTSPHMHELYFLQFLVEKRRTVISLLGYVSLSELSLDVLNMLIDLQQTCNKEGQPRTDRPDMGKRVLRADLNVPLTEVIPELASVLEQHSLLGKAAEVKLEEREMP